MCGIAGYVGPRELAPEVLDGCLELLRHRGPDHAGRRHFVRRDGRHVHLLSTRLTIIDLDPRSDQPFGSGSKWLSYNGELYNYVEVRRRLEARGRVFRTRSDTEVVLAALDEDGLDAFDAFEGMWALALYDEAAETLLLCRDRFGEKPLYILRADDGLYWGSEAKAVAHLAGRRLEPNLDQLRRYLVNGYKSLYKHGETFFHGLEEVEPATALVVGGDGGVSGRRYWHPAVAEDETLSRPEAVAAVRERLLRAVEIRLRADVPLAFMMSGGVDSVSLISIAKRVFDYDVHGFTIVSSDERYEERDAVARAVAELGIRHTALPTETRDFLPRLRELVRAHDAPVYTISYYAHWLLMREVAAAGYRISVSGTGADELFTGYYDHHLAYLAAVREDAELHAMAVAAWREHVRPHVRNPHLRDEDVFVRDPRSRAHVYLDAERFASYLANGRAPEAFAEREYSPSLLRNRMLNELFAEAVPVILHEDDLNAMSVSVENRSPYLDRELFELAVRIPTRHLIRDGYAKSILRDAMAGTAPAHVLESRRKVGFNASIHEFLDSGDPGVRAELLCESPVFELVSRDAVASLLERAPLPNSDSKFLFNFVNAKLFLEELG